MEADGEIAPPCTMGLVKDHAFETHAGKGFDGLGAASRIDDEK